MGRPCNSFIDALFISRKLNWQSYRHTIHPTLDYMRNQGSQVYMKIVKNNGVYANPQSNRCARTMLP